jgi:purine-cytosine permease-like protein
MNKKTSEKDKTVILSDEYVMESGVQGGKIMGEYIVLFSCMFGLSFFIMGVFMLVGFGFPPNAAVIIGALLLFVIGLLLMIGGYFIYRDKHAKNFAEKP